MRDAERREKAVGDEEVRRGRQEVAEILESITDAYFALDRRWRFTYVNAEAERLLSRPRGELVGRDLREELPETADSAFRRECRGALEEGVPVESEEHYPAFGVTLAVRAYPTEGGASVYFRDVSERKQAEEGLELRDRAIAASTSGIVITDPGRPDDPLVYVNPVFERLTG